MLGNKIKKGFTLSEVLLTLCVLGTLMAITLPVLMNGTNRNAYVNGLKKAYGLLDTATNTIMTNNSGTMIGYDPGGQSGRLSKYCSILECNKTCMQGHVVDQGCFHAQSAVKTLNGQNFWDDPTDYNAGAMILADGTLVFLSWTGYSTCDFVSEGVTHCHYAYVDVNGFNGPNVVGRDIFTFWITKDGLVPYGQTGTYADYTTYCNPSSANASDGIGCTAKVLNEGAMNY